MNETTRMKKALMNRRPRKERPIKPEDLLSTGSTLLNLAMSGMARGGLAKGKYYFVVGDSASGKTFITMTCFAEAAKNAHFDGYRFIHDNAEDGALMDFTKFFGAKANGRIEPPAGSRESPRYSSTIEEFYYNVDDALDRGVPFIYVLDSMDALESDDDRKKFREQKTAKRKAEKTGEVKKVSGSYGMAKAKMNSTGMRSVIARLKKSQSILIVISQTRDAVGLDAMFREKTRAGGKALRFYAHVEFWTSVVGTIKKKVNERDRKLGIRVQARVEKNRQTGRNVDVVVPIYWSHGLDETGGMIDYLVDEGHWKKKGGIVATELGVTLHREQLVRYVEGGGLEAQLRQIVCGVWEQIKTACTPVRKSRYE